MRNTNTTFFDGLTKEEMDLMENANDYFFKAYSYVTFSAPELKTLALSSAFSQLDNSTSIIELMRISNDRDIFDNSFKERIFLILVNVFFERGPKLNNERKNLINFFTYEEFDKMVLHFLNKYPDNEEIKAGIRNMIYFNPYLLNKYFNEEINIDDIVYYSIGDDKDYLLHVSLIKLIDVIPDLDRELLLMVSGNTINTIFKTYDNLYFYTFLESYNSSKPISDNSLKVIAGLIIEHSKGEYLERYLPFNIINVSFIYEKDFYDTDLINRFTYQVVKITYNKVTYYKVDNKLSDDFKQYLYSNRNFKVIQLLIQNILDCRNGLSKDLMGYLI